MTPRAWKRIFSRIVLWAGIVLALALLLYFASVTWRVYTKERQARQAHLDEVGALSTLQARQQFLTAELNALGTSRGVERVIRERYDVAKNGEQVLILTNSPRGTAGSAGNASPQSLWDRILGWFSW